jgi:hypothetical protein
VREPASPFEARLDALERAIADLDGRLAALERGAAAPALAPILPANKPGPGTTRLDLVTTLTLIGRTFVLVAGAYLLRALTEGGAVEPPLGASLGLAYAIGCAIAAYGIAARQPLSATFLAACTVIVGVPLLWEATMRFALLTPTASALVLTATTGLVLLIAWRRQLHALAWLVTIAAGGLAAVLLVATGQPVPFAAFLVALGVATLWLGYDLDWIMLRWPAGLVADVAVLGLVGRALANPPRDAPLQVMGVQLFLLVAYLGSIVIRTLVRGRDVIPFEAVQTGAMLLAGLGGALLIAHETGSGALTLGLALLLLSAACYASAVIHRLQASRANYYFYTSLALVFALAGSELLLDGDSLAMLLVALALAAAWSGRHLRRTTPFVHAVIFLSAAAIVSGLVATALAGLIAPAAARPGAVGPAAWTSLAAVCGCWHLSRTRGAEAPSTVLRALRLILSILLVTGAAGAFIAVVQSSLPVASGSPLHAGLLATLRTAVLAALALAVAWLGRGALRPEFTALVYPILGWGALKLLVEDVRTSPPFLLVVAFSLYGAALIVGPRIVRDGANPRTPA